MTHFSSPNSALNRAQLETLYRRSNTLSYVAHRTLRLGQYLGQALVLWLTRDPNQPHITQTQLASGEFVWHVYDPHTANRASFTSEAEVRAWLDQRYYH